MSVKENDWVSVEYEGTLDDGQVFDSSKGRDPLKFKVGIGMVIPGFNDGVIGMEVGAEKEIKVSPKEGYGEKNTEVAKLPKELLSGISNLEEGKEIIVMSGMGPLAIDIKKIEEQTIDAILNHPLAGKNLIFKIKLLEILSKEEAEEMDKMLSQACDSDCSHCQGECGEEHEEHCDCEGKDCDCEEEHCGCEGPDCDCKEEKKE